MDYFRVAKGPAVGPCEYVNVQMFSSCLSTAFLQYRQPAFAGTRRDSCHARGRHKRDTLYLRDTKKNIKFYTRILLLGVFMCDIYGGIECAGSISISFQCHLICGSFDGHVQLASDEFHIQVYSGLHNFSVCEVFMPRDFPCFVYPCRHAFLCMLTTLFLRFCYSTSGSVRDTVALRVFPSTTL